jgi:tetratricopeptide (TPR) repeat protein
MRFLILLLATTLAWGCAKAPDVAEWRTTSSHAALPHADTGGITPSAATIDSARNSGDLATARALALDLVSRQPEDPEALWRASRAESDAVWLCDPADRTHRDMAAASALDYAERAHDLGARSAAALGQHAWSLGNSTHLRPMMARSAHARATRRVALEAIEQDPHNADALATLATLHLRLKTLPAIARFMAFGAPKASLAEAEQYARAAHQAVPSLGNGLLVAKTLRAQGRHDAAREFLTNALNREDTHPRDRETRGECIAYLAAIDQEAAQ